VLLPILLIAIAGHRLLADFDRASGFAQHCSVIAQLIGEFSAVKNPSKLLTDLYRTIDAALVFARRVIIGNPSNDEPRQARQ
jgi:hypothetical protein